MIQLIASDMDGTLLSDHMTISDKNTEMIKAAQAQGIEFVIATGRAFDEAIPAVSQAGIECSYITSNGAQIFNKKGENILSIDIEQNKVVQVMDVFRKYDIYFELLTNQGSFSESEALRTENIAQWLMSTSKKLDHTSALEIASTHLDLLPIHYVQNFDELITQNNQKVLKFFAMGKINADALVYAKEDLVKLTGIDVTSSGSNNIEVNHFSAQKGSSLKRVADKLNIPMKNVAAFGDNFNDVSMIKAAGIGVAMGNAENEVKAIANFETLTNTEHGVAKAIENILNQQWISQH